MNWPPLYALADGASLFPAQVIASATTTKGPSSSTGLAIPTGAHGEAIVVVSIKAVGGTVDATLTECATTNGTYAAIAEGAVAITQVADAASSVQLLKIKMTGRLGFLRLEVVSGAGTSASVVSAVLVYGGLHAIP